MEKNTNQTIEENIDKILLENFSEGDYSAARQQIIDLFASKDNIHCTFKKSVEDENILVRSTVNGLKYLIFDNECISYARVGNKIGEYETIHFDGSNGNSLIENWTDEK